MRCSPAALVVLMASYAASSPVPGDDQAISDGAMSRIKELGLDKRDRASLVRGRSTDQPITEEQRAKITALGLDRRSDDDSSIEVRDSRQNCGQTITGGAAGGNGVWVPVGQYHEQVETFCKAKANTDLHPDHETSDTYGVTLTNQKNPGQPGDAGNVVFSIFNLHKKPTYVVNEDECIMMMKKQSNTDSLCYGVEHGDTKGGYWRVDSIGVFGSEIHLGDMT